MPDAVDVDQPHDLRGDRAARVVALLDRQEADPRQPEIRDARGHVHIDAAIHVHEGRVGRCELADNSLLLSPSSVDELHGLADRVDHQRGIHVHVACLQGHGKWAARFDPGSWPGSRAAAPCGGAVRCRVRA